MIQMILLTGFLGAGKTTLLEHLLDYYQGTKIGLIVNEFGEVNIDARLLEKDGISMSELSNGSIFCACIKENFVKALIDMSAHDLEYLFIEASGLADPSSMKQIAESIASLTVHTYHYGGSVCVIDGENFLEISQVLSSVQNQVAYAGAVLVNKEDLISPKEKTDILTAIQSINNKVPVFYTKYCKTDMNQLLSQLQPPVIPCKDSSNTPENRPQTFVLKISEHITLEQLKAFLEFISPFTYRIKGFAQVEEMRYSISCVRAHMILLPWPGDIPSSEIVLISSVGIGLTGAIADGIKKCAPKRLSL